MQVLATFLSVQAKAGARGQQTPTGQQLHALLQLIQRVLNEDGPTDHSVRDGLLLLCWCLGNRMSGCCLSRPGASRADVKGC